MYFVTYEGLHALYHLPDATLRRIGLGGRGFDRLRSHHRHHHRLDRMAHVNFNVTFPLMDWLMGTREKETAPAVAAPSREAARQPRPEARRSAEQAGVFALAREAGEGRGEGPPRLKNRAQPPL